MARRAFLALGANLGDRRGSLRRALALLAAAPGLNLLRQSRVYETEPMGVADQPEFLNMVAEVALPEHMAARELLALVKQIEQDVGRTRRERWGPREIDIDVLLIGEERVREGDFEVPHPRMWERAFVMAPLSELAPDLAAPSGETVSRIAKRLIAEQKVHAPVQL